MTDERALEAFWLHCDDPEPLRHCAGERATDRKLRLFSCACCRRIWHLVGDRARQVVEVAERFADGQATWEELDLATTDVFVPNTPAAAFAFAAAHDGTAQVADFAAWEAAAAVAASEGSRGEAGGNAARGAEEAAERKAQAELFRDILGNPFRPQQVKPSWIESNRAAVRALAQAAYDDRSLPSGTLDRGHLGVLADLLEAIGCPHVEWLEHLRGPAPHVRGCYVLDLILEKK